MKKIQTFFVAVFAAFILVFAAVPAFAVDKAQRADDVQIMNDDQVYHTDIKEGQILILRQKWYGNLCFVTTLNPDKKTTEEWECQDLSQLALWPIGSKVNREMVETEEFSKILGKDPDGYHGDPSFIALAQDHPLWNWVIGFMIFIVFLAGVAKVVENNRMAKKNKKD